MLSEREVRETEEGQRQGLIGPIVRTQLAALLADRREPLNAVAHLRQRLRQAYEYRDGLLAALEPAPDEKPTNTLGSPLSRSSGAQRPYRDHGRWLGERPKAVCTLERRE